MDADARITTECPHCLKAFASRVSSIGLLAQCRNCGKQFEVVELVELDGGSPPDHFDGFEMPDAPPPPRRLPPPLPGYAPPAPAYPPAAYNAPAYAAPAYQDPAYDPHYYSTTSWRAFLTPKWIGIAVGGFVAILGVLYLTGALSSDPNSPANRVAAAQAARNRPRPAAGSPPSQGPVANPNATLPTITWTTDDAGRAVGNAVASVRSARTELRVVLPPGQHAGGSLPCVFACPAGSNLLTGVPFGDDEREDYYGLLDRGIAVCFYTLDGTLKDPQSAGDFAFAIALQAYLKSGCGVGNLRDAIDTVLAGTPAVDPARLGTIGHSSAGTVALTGAGADPRVVAVAALAPAIDVPKRLGDAMSALPDLASLAIRQASPSSIDALTADVFIYHADDDDNTPAAESQAFADRHRGKVTLRRVATGGHGGAYDAGREPAMDFLAKTLRAKPAAAPAPASVAKAVPAYTPGGPDDQPVPQAAAVPSAEAVVSPAAPVAPVTVAPPAAPGAAGKAYWTKPRTDGTPGPGKASFLLVADSPPQYSLGADEGGATFVISAGANGDRYLGMRVLVLPDDGSAKLTSEGAPPTTPVKAGRPGKELDNGRTGFNVEAGYLVLPKSAPRDLPALGGGRVAVFDCGDDIEAGEPTREAVLAFKYEGNVVLVHASVPRAKAAELDAIIDSVRGWGLKGKKGSVATAFTAIDE